MLRIVSVALALAATLVTPTWAQECLDPSKIVVEIYDDKLCQNINVGETKANELTADDIATFNDCHELQLGDKKIYMQTICLKMSFNIQFFADSLCSEKLNDPDFRDLYTYEWNKCYKRTATQYMILKEPVWETQTFEEQVPGPVDSKASALVASAVSFLALFVASSQL